jgi:hypothetical protein
MRLKFCIFNTYNKNHYTIKFGDCEVSWASVLTISSQEMNGEHVRFPPQPSPNLLHAYNTFCRRMKLRY